jgi:hypothetical protein
MDSEEKKKVFSSLRRNILEMNDCVYVLLTKYFIFSLFFLHSLLSRDLTTLNEIVRCMNIFFFLVFLLSQADISLSLS